MNTRLFLVKVIIGLVVIGLLGIPAWGTKEVELDSAYKHKKAEGQKTRFRQPAFQDLFKEANRYFKERSHEAAIQECKRLIAEHSG